jgi:hypothetical protein
MWSSQLISANSGTVAGVVTADVGFDVAALVDSQAPIFATLADARLAAEFAALFHPSVAAIVLRDFGAIILAAELIARGFDVVPFLPSQVAGLPSATELAQFVQRLDVAGRHVDARDRSLVSALLGQSHLARAQLRWQSALLAVTASALAIAVMPKMVTTDEVGGFHPPGAPLPCTTSNG